jgi:exopolysaccharide production protein ExoY
MSEALSYLPTAEDVEARAPMSHGRPAVTAAVPRPVALPDATPRTFPLDRRFPRFLKRALDLGFSIVALPVLLVALPVLMLLVRIDSSGPAIFRQKRVGRSGKLITVYKLRSMHADAEERLRSDPELYREYLAHGHKLPAGCDPRITRVGRFLRKSSLDELPQMVSILLGTMSLVGPRPVLPDELDVLYGDTADAYLAVKPGLTGLWQVSGRSHVVKRGRVELDDRYVSNWRLRSDVRIILRTVPAVLCARGAH